EECLEIFDLVSNRRLQRFATVHTLERDLKWGLHADQRCKRLAVGSGGPTTSAAFDWRSLCAASPALRLRLPADGDGYLLRHGRRRLRHRDRQLARLQLGVDVRRVDVGRQRERSAEAPVRALIAVEGFVLLLFLG